MRCNECDYDLCSDCFGPRKDSMSKFEFELLEDSDEGAEADDEETDEDCEIEDRYPCGRNAGRRDRRRCEQSG